MISALDDLREAGEIRDYALMGAYAFVVWAEPVTTAGIDLVVLVDSDEQFVEAWRGLANMGDGVEGQAVIVQGLPVEIFPTTISNLFLYAMLDADEIELSDKMRVKLVTPEYLTLLALVAWRPKDRIRIITLREEGVADDQEAERLIAQFDEEGKLRRRYDSLDSSHG